MWEESERNWASKPYLISLASYQSRFSFYAGLLGVYDDYLAEPLARVLIQLGVKRGMVVYGMDKLDEISLSAPTRICEIKDGWFKSYTITPEEFGFSRCQKEDLKGGTPEENARITLSILNGEKGPKRDAVLLNAGAALYIGRKAQSLKEGTDLRCNTSLIPVTRQKPFRN